MEARVTFPFQSLQNPFFVFVLQSGFRLQNLFTKVFVTVKQQDTAHARNSRNLEVPDGQKFATKYEKSELKD